MSRRIRPSARKKTWHNVMCSALSETDKKCIEEVFEKFELQKTELEEVKQRADEWHREAELTAEKLDGAINAQETLQKALAEKAAEIEKLKTSNKNKLDLIHDLRSHLNDTHSAAIKRFAEKYKEKLRDVSRYDFGQHAYYLVGEQFVDNLVKEMIGE